MTLWKLYDTPEASHRHYKIVGPKGKPTWNGADKQRIVSVTTVLDGDDRLTQWAASVALGAAEHTARTFFSGVDAALEKSVLSFGQLVETTELMPDAVKDLAGAEGTAAHTYLSRRLRGWSRADIDGIRDADTILGLTVERLAPYGLRMAIEEFLEGELPNVVKDEHGPRVERVVGDYETAVAGTYDAQVRLISGDWSSVHRIDLKSSRTMQPKFFAQVAAYERLAVGNGEEPSDYLTIVHIDRAGNYKLHSIAVGSREHKDALALFDAHLTIYRTTPRLAKSIG